MISDGLANKLKQLGSFMVGYSTHPDVKKQQDTLGDHLGTNIPFVRCDASEMERSTCERVGVSNQEHPPVLVVAGEGYLGHTPVKVLEEAAEMPQRALDALKAADAKLYGRDSCIWTRRQIAILGDDYKKYVTSIDCQENPSRCQSEGVQGVPTWQFGSGKDKVQMPGFRFLGDLLRISKEQTGSRSGPASGEAN